MGSTARARVGRCVTLEVHDTFDAAAAQRLTEALAARGEGDSVVLDFTHTRALHPFAMARLVGALAARRGPTIHTRGLTEHHWGVLRHLHIDPATLCLLPAS